MTDRLPPARRLGALLEPLTGQVYFSPEAHAAYEALGFGPPTVSPAGLALPNYQAYFTSRGSVMGQVKGEVVAAAFGVFNPAAVVPAVTFGWTLTDAPTIQQARDDGALGQLERVLGAPESAQRAGELLARMTDGLRPEGRPLFAGLLASPAPDHPLGRLWREGDKLREYRGDCHIAVWASEGLDPVEIGLLTELYWGLPVKTYVRTRAWSDEQLDEGLDRLRSRGLLDAEHRFTEGGRALREGIEERTDAALAGSIAALGDDRDELFGLLEPWGVAVRSANGYPPSGPHDLASGVTRP
jgi:hypothetical protein